MLPHYAALKVAEQFRVLEAIAPGRIDLGLGRAPGSDGRTAYALNPRAETAADRFPADVRDLLAWLSGEKLIEGHPFRDIRAQPQGPTTPAVWVLGSSDYGAQVAAYFGLPFCFAHFIGDGQGLVEAMAIYREGFRPSTRLAAPHAALCVWALAAETQEEAAYHFRSREMWRLNRDRGVFTALLSPHEVMQHQLSDSETSAAAAAARTVILWHGGCRRQAVDSAGGRTRRRRGRRSDRRCTTRRRGGGRMRCWRMR